MARMAVILVRGSGDIASAVGHVLFAAGHSVVLHDAASPAHTRRGMSFVDGLYEGCVELEGTLGKRARTADALPAMLRCRRAIALTNAPFEDVASRLAPDILVDARMRKREAPEVALGLAGWTVGLGPGFVAGRSVHAAVETQWGEQLGRVVSSGATAPLGGEPRALGGFARERFVYAPLAGRFHTGRAIGERVAANEPVGRIGEVEIRAPMAGWLRGLPHDGAEVLHGTKVVEIEPREGVVSWRGIGERPRRVALGVLAAIAGAPNPWPAKPGPDTRG